MAFYRARAEAQTLTAMLKAETPRPFEVFYAKPIRLRDSSFIPYRPYIIALFDPDQQQLIEMFQRDRRNPERFDALVRDRFELPQTLLGIYPTTLRLVEEDPTTREMYHWARNGYLFLNGVFETTHDLTPEEVQWIPSTAVHHPR